MHHEIHESNRVTPTETNGYSLFETQFEEDTHVFFHATPAKNFESIVESGFRSAQKFGNDGLSSVSYAKRSFSCLAHLGNEVSEEFIVFAVRFKSIDQKKIEITTSDIKVYLESIQPDVICFCRLPSGFKVL